MVNRIKVYPGNKERIESSHKLKKESQAVLNLNIYSKTFYIKLVIHRWFFVLFSKTFSVIKRFKERFSNCDNYQTLILWGLSAGREFFNSLFLVFLIKRLKLFFFLIFTPSQIFECFTAGFAKRFLNMCFLSIFLLSLVYLISFFLSIFLYKLSSFFFYF